MADQLTLQDLTVHSGARSLVHNLSFSIQTGEIVALIGASGSGKSLTCSAALGVLPHGLELTKGHIRFNQQPIHPEKLRGRVISTIMQNPRSAFNPVHSMLHHGIETLKSSGHYEKVTARNTVIQAMRDAGLDDIDSLLKLYPHEMSGGMLQRMMIALTRLSQSPFLFADEPTTDLDLVMQSKVLELLDNLVKKQKIGILLVTHDMGVVARLAHRVMVMSQGQLIEQADVNTIFTTPRHPLTRELVNAHLSLYGMTLTQ